jgi:solute carrier family 35 protein E3
MLPKASHWGASRSIAAMAFNFLSSVGIVAANKQVFRAAFHFATSLTFWHYFVTALGLALLLQVRVFQAKHLDWRKCARLALGNISFVVFSNLSLQHNSVAFYQLMKHLSTPVVLFIEFYFYNQSFDTSLVRSLLIMVAGMVVAFATDFNLNALGTCFALISVVACACYAVWTGRLQRELDANPLQLQLYVAPMVAAMLIPFVLVADLFSKEPGRRVIDYAYTAENVRLLSYSGIAALCVNVSVFMVIGYTSSVTYCVLGIAKTSAIILTDFLFFGRPLEMMNLLGILIALAGVTYYSILKLQIASRKASTINANAMEKHDHISFESSPEKKQERAPVQVR